MRLLEVIVSSRIACSWSEATKMTSLKDENQRFKDTRLLCPNIGNPLRIPLEEYLLVAQASGKRLSTTYCSIYRYLNTTQKVEVQLSNYSYELGLVVNRKLSWYKTLHLLLLHVGKRPEELNNEESKSTLV